MKIMLKQVCALMLTSLMLIATCGLYDVNAEDAVDPYSYIFGKNYDISQGSGLYIGDGDMVCGGITGKYIGFKNVNFDRKPYELIVYLATGQFGQAELRLDSATGKTIATLTPKIGAWDVSEPITLGITDEIIGKHDLYFVWTAGPCNFDKMIFNTREKLNLVSEYAVYNENPLYTDIDGHIYENDIETCLALGLIESPQSDSYKPEMPVTRGEFAASLAAILGKNSGEEVSFSDVSFSDENYDAICAVAEAGLLRGVSETEFGINRFSTVKDALVAVLRLLGYEELAEARGGYPMGYLTVAQNLKLTNGLNTSDTLRKGNLARVLVNTINAEYIRATGVKIEQSESKEVESVAYEGAVGILYETQGIYKKTAVVEANNVTSIYDPAGGTGTNTIFADGKRYNATGTLGCSYLGLLCDYYYKEDGSLVAIVPNRNVKEVVLRDVLFTSLDKSGISYYETDDSTRTKTLKCDAKTLYIYNEKAVDREITEIVTNLKNFNGKIRWIDNNDDSVADFVMVNECENIVINSVSKNHIVGTKNGVAFSESFDDSAVVVFSKDGKEVSMDKIELGSVCMLYVSDNQSGEKFVRIDTYTSSVEGMVSEIDSGDVTINGVVYETHIDIKVGDNGIFYLNANNEIVNFKTSVGADKQVGLFLGFDEDQSFVSSFEVNIAIKVATKDGLKSISCADRVEIDGVKCTNTSDVMSRFTGLSEKKPILYRLDNNGKMTILDTLNEVTSGENDVLRQIGARVDTVYYRTKQRCFTKDGYLRYPVSETAVLMSYPNTDVDEYCTVGDFHSAMKEAQCIDAEFYSTTGSEKISDVVLWVNRFEGTIDGYGWDNPSVMVDSTFLCVDSNGNETMGIKAYQGKREVKLYIDAKSFEGNVKTRYDSSPIRDAVCSLKMGDLIQYMNNGNGETTGIKLIYSADANKNSAGVPCHLYNSESNYGAWTGGDDLYNINMLGTIDTMEDKITKVNLVNSDTSYVLISADVPVVEFNRSKGEIVRGISAASLQDGDYVVINVFDSGVSQVFRFVD